MLEIDIFRKLPKELSEGTCCGAIRKCPLIVTF